MARPPKIQHLTRAEEPTADTQRHHGVSGGPAAAGFPGPW